MKTAFIIIDVQNILVETGFETQKLLEKISYLQDQARKQQIEIIYIQHIETEEALTSEDWKLSPLLKRQSDEKVFQKRYNTPSAYRIRLVSQFLVDLSIPLIQSL